jgi:hypothetical protein
VATAREGATVPMHVLSVEGLDFEGWLRSRNSKQRATPLAGEGVAPMLVEAPAAP